MSEQIICDICVIGAGSGGLSLAAGASQMGAKTVLVEKAKMGGDCLNYGCVPSKALIAAGKAAFHAEKAAEFGIDMSPSHIDFAKVQAHIASVIASIAPHDSVERFEGLGVKVIQESARFIDPTHIMAGPTKIHAKYFVIATGSVATIPDIKGLASLSYHTNTTLFQLTKPPQHLIILGGGPMGVEMAQAYKRLNCQITLIEKNQILMREDPELVTIIRNQLLAENITIKENATVTSLHPQPAGFAVNFTVANATHADRIIGTDLLLATGRTPYTAGLQLEKAGVTYNNTGIVVDRRLRTSTKHIFAIGDVTGPPQFTHLAGYHASIVLKNILFRWPAKTNLTHIPRVTYTDPELATIGLNAQQASEQIGKNRLHILSWPYKKNDRAVANKTSLGMIKVILNKRGRVIGAAIVGASAGELITPWILAVQYKMHIAKMAQFTAPYPTLSEISKHVATSYFTRKKIVEKIRRVTKILLKF